MLNLTQMAGAVGQQAVRGERINRGYEDRTSATTSQTTSPLKHTASSRTPTRAASPRGSSSSTRWVVVRPGRHRSPYLQVRLPAASADQRPPKLESQYDGTVRDTSTRSSSSSSARRHVAGQSLSETTTTSTSKTSPVRYSTRVCLPGGTRRVPRLQTTADEPPRTRRRSPAEDG